MPKPSLGEGSGCYAGGPGPYEGPGSSGGPEPRLLVPECLSLLGHVASPDLPWPWNGSGPLLGEQDSGPQGSRCLDVVKDNYKTLA